MVRVSLVALTCLLVTASAPRAARDSVAERAAELVLNAPAAANEVWPGFSMPGRDWLVYDDTGAYLVTPSKPPAPFVAKGRMFVHAGPMPGRAGTLNLAYRLGDLTVVAVRAAATPERTAGLLYHEAFHVWQRERFSYLSAPAGPAGDYAAELTTGLAASMEVERRALRAAIRAGGIDTVRLQEAVAVRAQRAASSSDALRAAERNVERREGLARYVEEHSLARALRRSDRAPIDAIAAQLAIPLRSFGGSPDERLVRARAYSTGGAMGVLLDRLGVEWKVRAHREALDLLLAEHVALPPTAMSTLVADAYARYEHQELLTSTNPPWGALTGGLTEQVFDALAPYRLVLEVPDGTRPAWKLSTSAEQVSGMHRPAAGVLLLPRAGRFTADGPGFSAVVTDRPVRLDDVTSSGQRRTITVLLGGPPRLNGQVVAADLDATLSNVRIEADGVLVTVAGSVRVIADESGLRVSVWGSR
jgi:hypothetical protein